MEPSIEKPEIELKDLMEEFDIKAVLFDVDDTLLRTSDYYNDATMRVCESLVELEGFNQSPEEIYEILNKHLWDIYVERECRPINIIEQMVPALKRYIWCTERGECTRLGLTDDVVSSLVASVHSFYYEAPAPYGESVEFLGRMIGMSNLKVGLHSHAEDHWTEKKRDFVCDVLGVKREELPFLATDTKKDKCFTSWCTASQMLDVEPSRVMVVGDSFKSDIVTAVEAGVRLLIWIDRKGVGLPEEYVVPEGVYILVVNSLGEV